MLILQTQRQTVGKEYGNEQKISLTVEAVKDRLGVHCTDAMAEEILKQKNPGKKIEEIKKAFVQIARVTGNGDGYAFSVLSNADIGRLFVQNIDAFVEIAKAVRNGAGYAFWALENPEVGKLFAQNPDAFVQIAKGDGKWAGDAFYALLNADVGRLFAQNPDLVIRKFSEIAKASGEGAGDAFGAIGDADVGRLFAQNPDAFVQIAKGGGKWAGDAFYALLNADVGRLFAQNPDLVIRKFSEIAKVTKEWTGSAFWALGNPAIVDKNIVDKNLQQEVLKNPQKNMYYLMLRIIPLSDEFAIELGRPLDDLHEKPLERKKYLSSLSTLQKFGLLMSNPEFFYTSTNHMLFDRLNKDLNGKSLVNTWISKNKLFETVQLRNLIFRAMNYDRLAGKNGIFSSGDLDLVKKTLLGPILKDKKFGSTYYYLLANNLESIKKYGLEDDLRRYISKVGNADAKTKKAQEFLLNTLDGRVDESKTYYSPDLYEGKDGKLNIVQVFDKEDTEKDHWKLTQKWFSKYGKPTVGNSGELIYETKNARITLFMGETDETNQKFVRAKVAQDPNMIIAFRGHSFSLRESFPYDIFGNSDGHVLFIPGSCGSAGSVPKYLNANPNTDLRHFSNTSTGRGQVTNAIIDALIESSEMKFEDVLKKNAAKIEANGGDVSTIKVWSLGEQLISYVNRP